jgi:hypothetical protein
MLGDVARVLAQVGETDAAAQALAQVGETEVAPHALQQARAAARAPGDVAQTSVQEGRLDQALTTTLAAFQAASLAGRDATFGVLRDEAPILAAIDQGQTLWAVYGAVMEVERWLGSPGSTGEQATELNAGPGR